MSTMRTVYTNLRAARTAIKDIGRLRQIAAVLVRHGLGHVVEAWNLQDRAIVGLLVEKRPPDVSPRTLFERIAKALQELGPTFVKLGQILSTRPDLIPQKLCQELKCLQDQVEPFPPEAAREAIERALGKPIAEVFARFEDQPLASASIAQVHVAELFTGEQVVVKVRRPGIAQTIETDLHLLYWVARQLENTLPEAKAFDPVGIAREFERAISRELDFTTEAAHLERFARNFASWPQIKIPRLSRDLCTDSVLVMERLFGRKITEAAEDGQNMSAIAKDCVAMLFKMVFEDGFFHGDLHPGNLFVLDDGRIGLIDFGLVGRMTQGMKDVMADMLLHIATGNYEGVARAFYDVAVRHGRVDYPAWEADTVELLERNFSSGSLADVEFSTVLRDLIDGAIRHKASLPPDYTMFFKAMMTVEGIGKIVSPDLDLLAELRPHVEKVVARRYSPERVLKTSVETLQAFARFGRQFPITANEFLRQIEDGRLALGLDPTQLDQMEQAKDRRLNRALLAVAASTLILCGTLARNDAGLTLFGLPAVTTLCYVLGGYLGLRVFWRILNENF